MEGLWCVIVNVGGVVGLDLEIVFWMESNVLWFGLFFLGLKKFIVNVECY